MVRYLCDSGPLDACPISVVAINANIRRAYQKAGYALAELRTFRPSSALEVVRGIRAELLRAGCPAALRLEDLLGGEDIRIVQIDPLRIRGIMLHGKVGVVPGFGQTGTSSFVGSTAAASVPRGNGAGASLGAGGQNLLGPLGSGDDDLTRLLAAPTVRKKDWGFSTGGEQSETLAATASGGAGGGASQAEGQAAPGEGREGDRERRRHRHRSRRTEAAASQPDGPGAAAPAQHSGERSRSRARRRRRRDEAGDTSRHRRRDAADEPAPVAPAPAADAPAQPAKPAEPAEPTTLVFTPDMDRQAVVPGIDVVAGKRSLSSVPLFQWVSVNELTDFTDKPFRPPGRHRSRSRGKQLETDVAGRPLKLCGDAWEEPREKSGLKLLGEEVASGPSWHYVLQDVRRRSYAGLLEAALSAEKTQAFFERIRTGTDWQQPIGTTGMLPRKTCWMVMGKCTCPYRYGGVEVAPIEYPPWMIDLLDATMGLCGLTRDEWPNSCNVNLYDDGDMSVGWHADDERLFQGKFVDCRIISLSLGAPRTFEMRLNWPEPADKQFLWQVVLGNGDMMTMEGMMQKHFQHRVPREGDVKAPRINLTWRWVTRHVPRCPAERRR